MKRFSDFICSECEIFYDHIDSEIHTWALQYQISPRTHTSTRVFTYWYYYNLTHTQALALFSTCIIHTYLSEPLELVRASFLFVSEISVAYMCECIVSMWMNAVVYACFDWYEGNIHYVLYCTWYLAAYSRAYDIESFEDFFWQQFHTKNTRTGSAPFCPPNVILLHGIILAILYTIIGTS